MGGVFRLKLKAIPVRAECADGNYNMKNMFYCLLRRLSLFVISLSACFTVAA